jgi:plasmid stabilization system protein ParE
VNERTQVRVRASAREDLDRITAELVDRAGVEVALRFQESWDELVDRLARSPAAGRMLAAPRVEGVALRRRTIPTLDSYVVFYVFEEAVDVVRVLHGARDLPRMLGGRRRRRRKRG